MFFRLHFHLVVSGGDFFEVNLDYVAFRIMKLSSKALSCTADKLLKIFHDSFESFYFLPVNL